MAVARDDVLGELRAGIGAIDTYAGRMPDEGWATTACGDWTAAEVVAHVEAVSGWYHEWLDRAERGDASPAFTIEELPARNVEALRALPQAPPAAHVRAFVASATAYADRLPTAWDLPYGYPRGTVTAGQHAALAAVEWHVHAWDLAQVLGVAHAPPHATVLAEAAAATWLAAQGNGPVARVTATVEPHLAERPRDPWGALLRRMGRG